MFKTIQSALFGSFVVIVTVSFLIFSIFVKDNAVLGFLLSILAALILSIVFARSFALPIERLVDIAKEISKGKFPQTIVRKSRLETGKLEKAIEEMSCKLADMFQKLSFEKSQVSAILSGMAEGVLATDPSGRIILANPAISSIFSQTEPEIIGKTIREGLRNNEISDLFDETIKTNQMQSQEIDIITPVEASFAAHTSPIKNNRGELSGVVCVLYDITEIKKLENFRSEFVANVSHELKTPLTSIRNYVETLLGGAIDDKKHNQEFLGKIEKHALNLSGLIEDILEISRLESKKDLGPFGKVDIIQVACHAVDTIADKASKKGIDIEKHKKDLGEHCFVLGIEDHIYRAILNILDNAVNYTPSGGKIEISCSRSADNIELHVLDTGSGIARKDIPRIFERFYRVDKGRSRDMGGTGLGLAIVKHVMNIHHGQVLVESPPAGPLRRPPRLAFGEMGEASEAGTKGQGSKFTLVFPLYLEAV